MGRSKYKLLRKNIKKQVLPKELLVNIHKARLYVRNRENTNDIELFTPDISDHIEIIEYDPHELQKFHVDLDNVENIKQASKKDFINHKYDFNNPHRVTKEQIGLSKVKNIRGISKEFFLKELLSYRRQMSDIQENLFKILSKFGDEYVKKFSLNFKVKPSYLSVRVFYNDKWNEGLHHELYLGVYDYMIVNRGKVEKEGYILLSKNTTIEYFSKMRLVTFIIDDAEVYVNLKDKNGVWLKNTSFLIEMGNYEIYIKHDRYRPIYDNITVEDDMTINVHLERLKYMLEISPIPYESKVEIEVEKDKWLPVKRRYLLPGKYKYRVSLDNYNTINGETILEEKDQLINITLNKTLYHIKVTCNIPDAKIEVFYNNKWNFGYNFYLPYNKYFIRATHHKYEKRIVGFYANEDKEINVVMEKKKYTLIIYTNPSDAEVRINTHDDEWVIASTIRLESGEYRVIVNSELYKSKEIIVEIKDDNKIVNIEMEKITNKIYVDTIPKDGVEAKVFIDNNWVNIENALVPSGNYDILLSKPHYEDLLINVDISPILPILDTFVLEPLFYDLNIKAFPNDSIITVNNGLEDLIFFGNTNNLKLNYGEYFYKVESNGYKNKSGVVTIDADTFLDVLLEKNKYKFVIYINGKNDNNDTNILYKKINEDFIYDYKNIKDFEEGQYEFIVNKKGYKQASFIITIDKDMDYNLEMELLKYNITFEFKNQASQLDFDLYILNEENDEYEFVEISEGYYKFTNGDYKFKLKSYLYQDIDGEFTIDNKDTIKEIEILNPKIFKVELNVKDVEKYKIETLMNDKPVDVTYPSYFNINSSLEITVSKVGYKDFNTIVLVDNDMKLDIELEKELCEVQIRLYPINIGLYLHLEGDTEEKIFTFNSSIGSIKIPYGYYNLFLYKQGKDEVLSSSSIIINSSYNFIDMEYQVEKMNVSIYNDFKNSHIELYINDEWVKINNDDPRIDLPFGTYKYRIIKGD